MWGKERNAMGDRALEGYSLLITNLKVIICSFERQIIWQLFKTY